MNIRRYLSLAVLLLAARPAPAYIDLAPTLAKIAADSTTISVVEVTRFDRDQRTVFLKTVRSLKGTVPVEEITHQLSANANGAVPRQVLAWATGETGAASRAVMFTSRSTSLVCLGTAWYQVRLNAKDGTWKLEKDRPDLPLSYYGGISRLIDGIDAIQNKRLAIITVAAFATGNEGAMFDLALNHQSLPGLMRVERICVTASMPLTTASTLANPSYFVGAGTVDVSDVPQLIEKLKSNSAAVQADAADDLRTLGKKARAATPALESLLRANSPRVRSAAAAALLRIDASHSAAAATLAQELASTDPPTRRLATRYLGWSGTLPAGFAARLAPLLTDADEGVRLAALEAVATLGTPAAQPGVVDALIPMLDHAELAIDVADALGRLGPAARPALPRLAKLLASDQSDVRWAAVRGMSQIGGPDAHPAVDFLLKTMATASETEGYNMMIYFALLGPVAENARPQIKEFRMKNPMLARATLWAMTPEKNFPWSDPEGYGFGKNGEDLFGPGPAGELFKKVLGGTNLVQNIYSSYIHGLGPRLAPAAPALAKTIVENTGGDVPRWAYPILASDVDAALATLLPALESDDLATRERVAVALGYMGAAAEPAIEKLNAALVNAPTEREKKLLEWTLEQIRADGQ